MPRNDAFRGDDAAATPVIGVILMVAVTVILAAVIGTFVLNSGSDVEENVQAGVTVDATRGDPGQVRATFASNHNADRINVSITGGAATPSGAKSATLGDVGDAATFEETTAGATEVRITATAHEDHRSTVVLTRTVTI